MATTWGWHVNVLKVDRPPGEWQERALELSRPTQLVPRADRSAWLLFAASSLRGSRAVLASKEKKENEQTSDREARKKISE
jgi:hypothetical protein